MDGDHDDLRLRGCLERSAGVLIGLTWVLWATFVAEYVTRLVTAPSTWPFLRRT